MTLNLRNTGFLVNLCDSAVQRTFQKWIVPKRLQISQLVNQSIEDNLHMKFLALSVNFSSLNFNPLHVQGVLRTGASNMGTQNARFLLISTN